MSLLKFWISEFHLGFLIIQEGNGNSNMFCKFQNHSMQILFFKMANSYFLKNWKGCITPLNLWLERITLPPGKIVPPIFSWKWPQRMWMSQWSTTYCTGIGSKVIQGHRGQKGHFHQNRYSFRLPSTVTWLMHMNQHDPSTKVIVVKIHLGSFEVTGVKRSCIFKNLIS